MDIHPYPIQFQVEPVPIAHLLLSALLTWMTGVSGITAQQAAAVSSFTASKASK